MPIVFIHGVACRLPRFQELSTVIEIGLNRAGFNGRLDGFYWGDRASSLRLNGASIPGFDTGARAITAVPPAGADALDERQLMSLLIEDATLELRLLKDAADFSLGGGGFAPVPAAVEARNALLETSRERLTTYVTQDPDLRSAAAAELSAPEVPEAIRAVFEAAAATQADLDGADLVAPLSRALTSLVYQAAVPEDDRLTTPFDFEKVQALLTTQLELDLGGGRGLFDKVKELGLDAVTLALRKHYREKIMRGMSLFIGDVLVYMAHRTEIQAALAAKLTQLQIDKPGPLHLVGHSLGGVIAYDYCATAASPVAGLVTVGSQVGVLEEFGVLQTTVQPGADKRVAMPAQLGRWLNVYDVDDMLSFATEPVFTGPKDFEVNSKAPFPTSHSAYWTHQPVYQRIVQTLA